MVRIVWLVATAVGLWLGLTAPRVSPVSPPIPVAQAQSPPSVPAP
jgi:hypothetical protein